MHVGVYFYMGARLDGAPSAVACLTFLSPPACWRARATWKRIARLLVAATFSLLYVSMYPILIGGGVIYVYPYWPPAAALAWVAGGVLVQAWFSLRRSGRIGRSGVLSQVGAGLLYTASIAVLSGGCYQS